MRSSISDNSDHISSLQSMWHHGETSSREYGSNPIGVERRITDLGTSIKDDITECNAVSRQGGETPSIITTRSGSPVEESHQLPGKRHLVANNDFRCF